ncbi:alpha/beta hydrolase [Mangrovactinospora gilvigrisea]|uniref:Alpha/beta hydrolase n=2 Tax=Mangrovactinospora gilvigrisea TaxID=1428644 RepID=A0A1J7BKX2_9ACTN|nr:alpha/beta hydrolase [Mangrovactinospora gilvigrisea]
MTDGATISWTRLEGTVEAPPVVLLHGGPGLADGLRDVAPLVEGLAPVYRYDQRGTGGSPWEGRHTFALHIADLVELLDQWGAERAVLIGHSYGASLASRFVLAHPDRVAALLLLCGPNVGDWRAGYQAERDRRMTAVQQERLRTLQKLPERTEEQETELLTLSWFTDHADLERGWEWAAQSAATRRANRPMNAELGKEGHADLLDDHLDEIRACLPAKTEILSGVCDPRPIACLEELAARWRVPLTRIEDAGHEPWLEQPETVRGHLRRFVHTAVTE